MNVGDSKALVRRQADWRVFVWPRATQKRARVPCNDRFLASQPGPWTTHDMKMQVMHLLATLGTGVGHDPKAAFGVGTATLLQRQSGRQRHHPPDQRLVLRTNLRHGVDVHLGNHQKCTGAQGLMS